MSRRAWPRILARAMAGMQGAGLNAEEAQEHFANVVSDLYRGRVLANRARLRILRRGELAEVVDSSGAHGNQRIRRHACMPQSLHGGHVRMHHARAHNLEPPRLLAHATPFVPTHHAAEVHLDGGLGIGEVRGPEPYRELCAEERVKVIPAAGGSWVLACLGAPGARSGVHGSGSQANRMNRMNHQ